MLLSACKVERTPAEYFDHQESAAAEREASAGEVRARLLAFAQALARGSPTQAMFALAPAADARVITPEPGMVLSGADQISAALDRVASTPLAVRMREVQVTVSPQDGAAWFDASMEVPGTEEEGGVVQITGVYLRRAGIWNLVQAHVSTARPPAEAH